MRRRTMKEIYGGILLAAALAAAIGAGFGGGVSTTPSGGRQALWNDLRKRDAAPETRGARFASPQGMPIATRSPSELTEPMLAFAGELTSRAADLSRRMSPEMGLPALITSAAAALTEDEAGGSSADEKRRDIGVPRELFAAIDPFSVPSRSSPGKLHGADDETADAPRPAAYGATTIRLPIPRPSPAERAAAAAGGRPGGDSGSGVIAAVLGALRSIGLAALDGADDTGASPESSPRAQLLPAPELDPRDPATRGLSDRAALPGLNPGPPRDPFTDLRAVYRDRAPGVAG